jgi:hypothetical protein
VLRGDNSKEWYIQYQEALSWANEYLEDHRWDAKKAQVSWVAVELVTIVSGGVATVISAADTGSPRWRAGFAAAATVGATLLGIFRFGVNFVRHRQAEHRLLNEIEAFELPTAQYRPPDPVDEARRAEILERFFRRVCRISEEGYGDQAALVAQESTKPDGN